MSPGSFNCSRFRDRVTAAGQPLILGAMTAYSALIGSGILAAFVDFRVHSGRSVSDWAIMAWSHRGTVALRLRRRLARARTARPGPPTGGPVRSDFLGHATLQLWLCPSRSLDAGTVFRGGGRGPGTRVTGAGAAQPPACCQAPPQSGTPPAATGAARVRQTVHEPRWSPGRLAGISAVAA